MLLLLLALGADPTPAFTVENKTIPAFTVVNKTVPATPTAPTADPYGFKDYATFHAAIGRGRRGVLVVGVTDPWVGTYQFHCRVPSGFGGLADGEYDCWSEGGRTLLTLRTGAPAVAPARPFPAGASTRPTVARPAGGSSSASTGIIPTALTGTGARSTGPFGVTNCPPGFG